MQTTKTVWVVTDNGREWLFADKGHAISKLYSLKASTVRSAGLSLSERLATGFEGFR